MANNNNNNNFGSKISFSSVTVGRIVTTVSVALWEFQLLASLQSKCNLQKSDSKWREGGGKTRGTKPRKSSLWRIDNETERWWCQAVEMRVAIPHTHTYRGRDTQTVRRTDRQTKASVWLFHDKERERHLFRFNSNRRQRISFQVPANKRDDDTHIHREENI